MEFGWTDEDAAFREELRSFVASALDGEWRGAVRQLGSPENVAHSKVFNRRLAERGWLTPHWPAEHGGRAATPWQHIILGEELWSVGEPRGPQYMNVNWIGPSILAHGTDEQKATLPAADRARRGRVVPGLLGARRRLRPGLAAHERSARRRRVRRVRPEGLDVVRLGRRLLLPARAHRPRRAERHAGISVLLVPTSTEGFVITEVPSVVGDHAFHELFFDEMRVPASCRLGPENEGWAVVREALSYERVGGTSLRPGATGARPGDAMGRRQRRRAVERAAGTGAARSRASCDAARLLAYRVIDQRAAQPPAVGHLGTSHARRW